MNKTKNSFCRVCGRQLSESDIQSNKRACSVQQASPFTPGQSASSKPPCSDIFSEWLDRYKKLSLDGNLNNRLTIKERRAYFKDEKKILLDMEEGIYFPLMEAKSEFPPLPGGGFNLNSVGLFSPTFSKAAEQAYWDILMKYVIYSYENKDVKHPPVIEKALPF